MTAAYQTGKYRNVFLECGYSKEEIQERVEKTFETIFYGTEEERFYHEVGEDMAYVEDTGNHDVRTEGMSYAMMVCVQMNRKEEFDRLWKWVRTYMYIPKGPGKNYFAWSCGTDGTWNSDGPAPDGEEFFAMSLFFAWRRWGDGEGIFEYSKEARAILKDAPIVVLDEATAYADPENEEKMEAAIAELVKGKTLVVIAHKLPAIMNADQICVMDHGKLVATGKHQELIQSCPEYQKLWKAAQDSAEWKVHTAKEGK